MEQRGGALLVSVATGLGPSTITGRLEATRATFALPFPSHNDDPIVFADMISDARMLMVDGIVWTPLTRNRFEGSLDGRFRVFEDGQGAVAECESNHHQFVMWR